MSSPVIAKQRLSYTSHDELGSPGLEDAAQRGVSRQLRQAVGVSLVGLHRCFGQVVALDDFSLEVNPGELLALLGPSGSGKTTALRVLAGLERPERGRVLVGGADVTKLPPHRRGMGMVFQAYSLFPNMTALENVAFGLRLRRVSKTERRKRATSLLELVGLSREANRHPHQLSGGQQQRVALARALAIEPRVLLLDEPLSALDAAVRVRLREEIRRVQLDVGITTVFVTHDQEEALSMADRVAVLADGHLEQVGTPSELYSSPATGFVARFVGTTNELPGRLLSPGAIEVLGRQLPVPQSSAPQLQGLAQGSALSVLVRPEALSLRFDPEGQGHVLAMTFLGATLRARIKLPGMNQPIAVTVPPGSAGDVRPGQQVTLELSGPVLFIEPAGASPSPAGTASAPAGASPSPAGTASAPAGTSRGSGDDPSVLGLRNP
jgi:putative spermidine/putrescine transport system ATP-binding protein